MRFFSRARRSASALLLLAFVAGCVGDAPEPRRGGAPPVLAALDAAGLPDAVRGRVLLGELGCVVCHDAGAASDGVAPGPDLREVGARIRADYLHDYLASPCDREPGTAMPDLLRRWDGAELQERAASLAAYLRSFASAAVDDGAPGVDDPDAAARGEALYRRIGCCNCHGEGAPPESLRRKYTTATLQTFLLAPHEARPSLRMPDFALSPAEAHDLAHFLRAARSPSAAASLPPAAVVAVPAVRPAQVARGRELFGELRCARCHALPDAQRTDASPPPPLADLDPARGCLSGAVGPWPYYALSEPQRVDLRRALADHSPPSAEDRVLQALASRNCTACHRRGSVDAVTPRLGGDLFGTDDPTLGLEGQVPPTLDGVGARLQRMWLGHTIARGQRERPYLHVRMPGFGEPFAERLATLLADVDVLPPIEIAPLPDDDEAAKPILTLGRDLVGDQGMNCISCHRFAGEQAGAMGAIDLVDTTGRRLRPEWFAHFLREPFRFKPTTLMPHFFPGGVSTRPQFADGSVQRQVDAIWHYLAGGRNVPKPSGLRQPPIELEVGDEAVLLRRAVQGAGKRGIAVGYPGGVNVTFDAEALALNQIWWGRFVDARPVWTSQGHGQAQILSRDVVALPNGPAFAVLDADDAAWPAATRRDRGDRWLGYDLDDRRRPTFRYTAGDATIADAPREERGDGGEVRLRRTLTVAGGGGALSFRVAVHRQIQRLDEQTVQVGDRLAIRCTGAPWSICSVSGQEESELRLRVPAARDREPVVVELDYSALEKGR